MDFLSDLDPEVIASLSNEDFQDSVQTQAKSLSGEALDTYQDVMNNSEDDKARVLAADRVMSLAGIDDNSSSLPSGVSEEVFKIAIAGLSQLASIAKTSSKKSEIFRDVSPAKSDPRAAPFLPPINPSALTPLSFPNEVSEINDSKIKERYEIIDRTAKLED